MRDNADILAKIVLGSDSARIQAPNDPASGAGPRPCACADSDADCGLTSLPLVLGNGLGASPALAQSHGGELERGRITVSAATIGLAARGVSSVGMVNSAATAPETAAAAATARASRRSRNSRRPGIESSTAIAPGRCGGPVDAADSPRATPCLENAS